MVGQQGRSLLRTQTVYSPQVIQKEFVLDAIDSHPQELVDFSFAHWN